MITTVLCEESYKGKKGAMRASYGSPTRWGACIDKHADVRLYLTVVSYRELERDAILILIRSV